MKRFLFAAALLAPSLCAVAVAPKATTGLGVTPSLKSDSAFVNVRLMNADKSADNYIEAITASYEGIGEIAPQKMSKDATHIFSLFLNGDMTMHLMDESTGRDYGYVRVAPGETIDVRVYNDSIVTNGKFADYNRALQQVMPKYAMNLFICDFISYDMTGNQYTQALVKEYGKRKAQIATDKSLSPLQKTYENVKLLESLLSMASNRDMVGKANYMMKKGDMANGEADAVRTDMSQANFTSIAKAIDQNSQLLLLMDPSMTFGKVEWDKYAAPGSLLGTMAVYQRAMQSAIKGNSTPELDAKLKVYKNKFFASAVKSTRDQAIAKRNEASKLISKTPDVSGDKVIEAIAAQYPGKVVLIDCWNTWCGPCKAAIAENEPLKDTEFAGLDIQWVYVADESSPLPAYYKMVPKIKGAHYRLSKQQSNDMLKYYNVDGIPFYFMVGKDGKLAPRPDFRDHKILIKTLKEEAKK